MKGAFYFVKAALEHNKSVESFNKTLEYEQEPKLHIKPIYREIGVFCLFVIN